MALVVRAFPLRGSISELRAFASALAGARAADATQEFHVWFEDQVLGLTGIDPNEAPLGPPTTEVFSWSAR